MNITTFVHDVTSSKVTQKTHPSHLNTHSHTFMINPTPPLQAIMKGQQKKNPLSKLAYEEAMTYPTFNLLLEESLKPPSHLAIPYPMPWRI